MLRTAAKYTKPTRIQNHTRGLYQFMYSILLFPPERAGKASLILRGGRKKTGIPVEEDCTCHIVSDAHSGERDHNKVDGLQGSPALDVFEDDSRNGDEDDAASQDEEDGGGDSDFSLADLPVFLLFQVKINKLIKLEQ